MSPALTDRENVKLREEDETAVKQLKINRGHELICES